MKQTARVARSAEEIEDETPLAGARVDVDARIGWLLRSSRVAHGVHLRAMADRVADLGVPASASSLSRLETSGARNGRMIDVYERALGLPYGRLRTPVDILCNTFSYARPDADPLVVTGSLDDFTDAWERVTAPFPAGSEWLRFIELQTSGPHGLPGPLMQPYVERLVSELGRSVNFAYTTRYVAVEKLLESEYAPLVAGAVRKAAETPHAQALADALNVLAEYPTAGFVNWCGQLLLHGHPAAMRAAAMALESVRTAGELPDTVWVALAPDFVAAYERAAPGSWARGVLTTLYTTMPPVFRHAARFPQPLETVKAPVNWTRNRRNEHYEFASTLAHDACERSGRSGAPLLARLVFEALYDFRDTLCFTASLLINAAGFAPLLKEPLLAAATDGPELATRRGAGGALWRLAVACGPDDLEPLLSSGDSEVVNGAILLGAHTGVALSDQRLRGFLVAGDPTARLAMYSAGMTDHALLREIACDSELPEGVAGAAAWWAGDGSLVTR